MPARTHGMSTTPLYALWLTMKRRCDWPDHHQYADYGGRGITVCDRWLDFSNFAKDMLPTYQRGLLLDRADNDKGYSPDNCRWVTRSISNKNRRPYTHCRRGHEFIGRNLVMVNGFKRCRTCHNQKRREYYARRKTDGQPNRIEI